jgi:hypothetical protein
MILMLLSLQTINPQARNILFQACGVNLRLF